MMNNNKSILLVVHFMGACAAGTTRMYGMRDGDMPQQHQSAGGINNLAALKPNSLNTPEEDPERRQLNDGKPSVVNELLSCTPKGEGPPQDLADQGGAGWDLDALRYACTSACVDGMNALSLPFCFLKKKTQECWRSLSGVNRVEACCMGVSATAGAVATIMAGPRTGSIVATAGYALGSEGLRAAKAIASVKYEVNLQVKQERLLNKNHQAQHCVVVKRLPFQDEVEDLDRLRQIALAKSAYVRRPKTCCNRCYIHIEKHEECCSSSRPWRNYQACSGTAVIFGGIGIIGLAKQFGYAFDVYDSVQTAYNISEIASHMVVLKVALAGLRASINMVESSCLDTCLSQSCCCTEQLSTRCRKHTDRTFDRNTEEHRLHVNTTGELGLTKAERKKLDILEGNNDEEVGEIAPVLQRRQTIASPSSIDTRATSIAF